MCIRRNIHSVRKILTKYCGYSLIGTNYVNCADNGQVRNVTRAWRHVMTTQWRNDAPAGGVVGSLSFSQWRHVDLCQSTDDVSEWRRQLHTRSTSQLPEDWSHFTWSIIEAKCILATAVCASVCLSVCLSVCPSPHSHATAPTQV